VASPCLGSRRAGGQAGNSKYKYDEKERDDNLSRGKGFLPASSFPKGGAVKKKACTNVLKTINAWEEIT
jgi:hypothetical protein